MIFGSSKLKINRLASGGLITNYNCPSRCAHCLYNSGPERETDYITGETAVESFKAVKSLGCGSVHIGGGRTVSESGWFGRGAQGGPGGWNGDRLRGNQQRLVYGP